MNSESATRHSLGYLDQLEAEAIYILREVAAQFERPIMLYSVGKDSSCLLHLAEKAFAPGPLPFPLLHIDTGFKFPEMYQFRDQLERERGHKVLIHRNEEAIARGSNPYDLGTQRCCGFLKTEALLQALAQHRTDAAIGGARRDEEKSRAKERIFSFRDPHGQWEPRRQRPELWALYNGTINPGESIRVFPLSNWTELDIWLYLYREAIPIVPLYYAASREVVQRGGLLIPTYPGLPLFPGEKVERVQCRFRTLGCIPCTGAIASEAQTMEAIIEEVTAIRISERATRAIDHDSEGSMEKKKKEGYF